MMNAQSEVLRQRVTDRLQAIYESVGPEKQDAAEAEFNRWYEQRLQSGVNTEIDDAQSADRFNERDAVLITYADLLQSDDRTPLAELHDFLKSRGVTDLVSHVHLLPFYPYSSDDGFSVIDYRAVNPSAGSWDDVASLCQDTDLMFDLVLNHCSRESDWFQRFCNRESPYDEFFIEADPDWDLSQVTRPRSLPLLTEVETKDGKVHVWTTFSDDQIDLNFASPRVLVEFLDILMYYVYRGARIIRLDAIAYLWKRVGTSCIHLKPTHEVVKLCRDVLELLAPDVWLLTETNVPHRENVSYFGDGDEAHMVYQFSLPPLLLDAFINGDVAPLRSWLEDLESPPEGATYFNFTASHDGVGVRPLEGLVDRSRMDRLVEAIKERGGHVSTRRQPDGTDSPYEMNISYVSALGAACESVDESNETDRARAFLASQAFMLSLQGVPGIYFHSLVGTPNDDKGVADSGIPRRINRHQYRRDELESCLASSSEVQRRIFDGYCRLLKVRREQPAFSPTALQRVVAFPEDQCLGVIRSTEDGSQEILVVINVSDTPQQVLAPSEDLPDEALDLITGTKVILGEADAIEPHGVRWFVLATT